MIISPVILPKRRVQEKDVNFYSKDGELLYSFTLAEAHNLTALPVPPNCAGLNSLGWNYTLEEVQSLTSKCYIGAVYETDDDTTRFYFSFLTAANSNIDQLNIKKATADEMIIEWGDGTTSTSAVVGDVTFSHNYNSAGDFTLKIICEGNYSFETWFLAENGDFRNNALTRVELSNKVTKLDNYAFGNCFYLKNILIPTSITYIGFSVFNYSSIIFIIIPRVAVTIGEKAFIGCNSVQVISFNFSIAFTGYSFFQNGVLKINSINQAAIPDYSFYNNQLIKEVTISENVTSIGINSFNQMKSVIILKFEGVVPPIIQSNSFSVRPDLTVLVPAASLYTYQTTTNYGTLAPYMIGY